MRLDAEDINTNSKKYQVWYPEFTCGGYWHGNICTCRYEGQVK